MTPFLILGALALLIFAYQERGTLTAAVDTVANALPIPDPGVFLKDTSAVVQALAFAISVAEGYQDENGIPGSGPHDGYSLPYFHNNPGDLIAGGQNTAYATPEAGWQALYDKLTRMLAGRSTTYPVDITIQQLAQIWTGGDNPGGWSNTVTRVMGDQGYQLSAGNTVGDITAYA